MATTILRLDRGSAGTLNLNDITTISLADGWRTRVAKRRQGTMGNRSRFMEVEETIPLSILRQLKNTTPPTKAQAQIDVYAKLQELSEAIEQVERFWRREEGIDPVILEYQPDGASEIYRSLVLRVAESSQDLLELPVTFNRDIQAYLVDRLQLRLLRRGELLEPTDTPVLTSLSTDNQNALVTTALAANVGISSPIKIDVEADNTVSLSRGFFFFANDADYIEKIEAEDYTSASADVTIVANTQASGGEIIRVTPTTTAQKTIEWNSTVLNGFTAQSVAVFASLRNVSATISYTVNVSVTAGIVGFEGRNTVISPNSGGAFIDPTSFGTITTPATGVLPTVKINITPSDTGGAGDVLEIDYIVLLAVNHDSVHVIKIENAFSEPNNTLTIDHRILEKRDPIATQDTLIGALQYRGNVFVSMTGDSISSFLMASAGDNWQLREDQGGFPLVDVRFTYTRTPARLVAQ